MTHLIEYSLRYGCKNPAARLALGQLQINIAVLFNANDELTTSQLIGASARFNHSRQRGFPPPERRSAHRSSRFSFRFETRKLDRENVDKRVENRRVSVDSDGNCDEIPAKSWPGIRGLLSLSLSLSRLGESRVCAPATNSRCSSRREITVFTRIRFRFR